MILAKCLTIRLRAITGAVALLLLGVTAILANYQNPDAAEFFVRVQSITLAKLPDGRTGTEKLEFREQVQVIKRSQHWVKVSVPGRKLEGWIPLLALTSSKQEIDDLAAKNRIPRSIVMLEGKIGPLRSGVRNVNLVGSQSVDRDKMEKMLSGAKKKFEITMERKPGDCLILDAGAVAEMKDSKKTFQGFFKNWGADKITAPKAGVLYFYTEANKFEPLTLSAITKEQLVPILEKQMTTRFEAARTAQGANSNVLPEVDRLEGHGQGGTGLVFSEDGASLTSFGSDGTVRKWEIKTGSEDQRQEFQIQASGRTDQPLAIGRLAFLDGGKQWLIELKGTNQLYLWDVTKRTLSSARTPNAGSILDWSIRPQGEVLVVTSSAGPGQSSTLHLWDYKKAKEVRKIVVKTGYTNAAAFSPDGKKILSGGGDNNLHLWDVATGKLLRSFKGHTGAVTRVIWSKDGKSALSGGQDQKVRLWDVEAGTETIQWAPGGHAETLALSDDNKRALVAVDGQWFGLYDVATGKHLCKPSPVTGPPQEQFAAATIKAVAFSPDGQLAASVDYSGTIKLWLLPSP